MEVSAEADLLICSLYKNTFQFLSLAGALSP